MNKLENLVETLDCNNNKLHFLFLVGTILCTICVFIHNVLPDFKINKILMFIAVFMSEMNSGLFSWNAIKDLTAVLSTI